MGTFSPVYFFYFLPLQPPNIDISINWMSTIHSSMVNWMRRSTWWFLPFILIMLLTKFIPTLEVSLWSQSGQQVIACHARLPSSPLLDMLNHNLVTPCLLKFIIRRTLLLYLSLWIISFCQGMISRNYPCEEPIR